MFAHTLNKTCGKCGILDKSSGVCRLTARQVDPDADFCSEWTDNVKTCDLCGKLFIGPGTITETEDGIKITCASCDDNFYTCRTCVNRQHGYCKFHDQSFRPDIPPIITQSMQRGPAIMQMQVHNPEREKITCEDGCECFNEDFGCCREVHTCGNHKLIW